MGGVGDEWEHKEDDVRYSWDAIDGYERRAVASGVDIGELW